MGLRDWFRSAVSKPGPTAEETAREVPADDEQAFATLQDLRAEEALSLFEEEEPLTETTAPLDAPYDASQAQADDLLDEHEESFTHIDEVSIEDVNDLEDPYLTAIVEGDVPEAVVFDGDENQASV